MTDSLRSAFLASAMAGTLTVVVLSATLGSKAVEAPPLEARSAVTYAKEIAPILARECAWLQGRSHH